ncbi:MAG: GNAT family N-acetyltransferase [Oscillospiraceae bacterium]|jgi:GNAT superfamily N-acetyltransferase|nr:GNAT family N-acetyltransferase [Oscillospiraceae bacterium]
MRLTNKDILSSVRAQLAVDLNCKPDDFDRDGFVFCEAKDNPGRRPFPRGERHFEMYTMGGGVVVSATPDILPYLREQLDGKNRDEAFDMPFVYGQGICHLPDVEKLAPIPVPGGIEIVTVAQPDIASLYVYEGFEYALNRGPKPHARPDMLATVAYANGVVVGMAGASDDCEMMWQIGLNVLPEYRNRGIASVLTNRLATEILERGKIPYYGAATSNIFSQRVACRAGFHPTWACVYRGRFDDSLTAPTS